jgi:hypothetical protein
VRCVTVIMLLIGVGLPAVAAGPPATDLRQMDSRSRTYPSRRNFTGNVIGLQAPGVIPGPTLTAWALETALCPEVALAKLAYDLATPRMGGTRLATSEAGRMVGGIWERLVGDR